MSRIFSINVNAFHGMSQHLSLQPAHLRQGLVEVEAEHGNWSKSLQTPWQRWHSSITTKVLEGTPIENWTFGTHDNLSAHQKAISQWEAGTLLSQEVAWLYWVPLSSTTPCRNAPIWTVLFEEVTILQPDQHLSDSTFWWHKSWTLAEVGGVVLMLTKGRLFHVNTKIQIHKTA